MDTVVLRFIRTSNELLDLANILPTPSAIVLVGSGDFESARKNLRFLRNLHGLNLEIEGWINLDGIGEQYAKINILSELISFYASQLKIASLDNPEKLAHYTIEMANLAVGAFGYGAALHAYSFLPDGHEQIEKFEEIFASIPEEWEARQMQSVERLLDDLESAITHLANKPIGDRSPIDELLEISEKIQEAAKQLYSIDSLQDPAREESIELAREILRRLKNMIFSDKPIEEAMEVGETNEKLAFARKLAEMVDMYKNLLGEALLLDPSIIHDPRVKKASGAVDECAEGVKIMALKEIASRQGADAAKFARDKDKQEERDKKSTKNLMNNMEGGLEVAAAEIEAKNGMQAKAQAEQKKAQAERERMERARRRRARRNEQILQNQQNNPPISAVVTQQGVQQNVNNRDRNTRRTAPPPPPPAPPKRQQSGVVPVSTTKTENTVKNLAPAGGINLNKDALEAVRQAGSALRNSNRQAVDLSQGAGSVAAGNNITKPVANSTKNVSEAEQISPDDKSFAAKEKDKNNPMQNRNKNNLNM